jgi:tetratricopeptide (TPR) repeat protein
MPWDMQGADAVVNEPEQSPARTAEMPEQRDREYRAAHAAGVAFAEKGDYSSAMRAFEVALSLRPDSTDALFNLGACHEAIGDPARAVNIYRRVLEITPDDPDCFANLGTSFIKMYHREKSPVWRRMARDAWERSLELNPGQAKVKEYLARTESLDG